MNPMNRMFCLAAAAWTLAAPAALAQAPADGSEALKIAAVEALISAPPERALPRCSCSARSTMPRRRPSSPPPRAKATARSAARPSA